MKYKVPYDADGNVIRYPGRPEVNEWRENTPFEATMRIPQYPRFVNDKTWLTLEDEHGHRYPMLAVELARAVYSGVTFENNQARALWDIRKTGVTYGLRLAKRD